MRSLTRAEVREVDRLAIQQYGVPGVVLMENAGAGAARLLEAMGIDGPVVVVCGKGNNGGDGFVIGRHLDAAGHAVRFVTVCDRDAISGDARVNLEIAERSRLEITCLATADQCEWEGRLAGASWIVDALLGTGASGPSSGAVAMGIAAINAVRTRGGVKVLAVDLPSGMDCDTGAALGVCVRADVTATFVAPKRGFEAPSAAGMTGTVHVVSIGAPRAALCAPSNSARPCGPA